jgi:N-acyl-D-aspartate/D-glutamate deacylase
VEEHWESQKEYAAAVNRRGTAIDIAPSIGHGTLRLHVGARGRSRPLQRNSKR